MLRDVGGTAYVRSSFPPEVCCMQGFAVCPNLPFGLCPRLWDEEHMPEADEDDARLYGSDEPGSNPGAAWLLVLAGIIGLAALVPSGGNTASKRSRSCGAAALLGVLVGLYLALQLFPNQHLVQVGIACTNSLLATNIVSCSGWFSTTGMLASASLGHCLVLAQTLLQLKYWSMFRIFAHALAIARMLVFSLQRHDLPLPVAVLCTVCTASSSLAMAMATVCLLHEPAAIRPASSLAHSCVLLKDTLMVVLIICRQ